jgi:hypothetical protein
VSAPLGPDNINVAWPFMKSAHAHGNSSIADLATQDQDAVVAAFKAKMLAPGGSVFTSDTGPLADVWAGLRRVPGVSIALSIIEAIVQQAFAIGDEFNSVGAALEAAATQFGNKWTGIIDAKNAADYALAQLSVSNRPIYDLFDRPIAAPGANWDVFNNLGPGGGYPETDGNGNLSWHSVAGFTGKSAMRWNPARTTGDNQVISTVMPNRVQDTFAGQASFTTLCGRVNDSGTMDTYVGGQASAGGANIHCLVAGTRTDFGANPVSVADSDTWDFYVGYTGVDDDHFVLVRNGIPVVDVDATDGTTTAQKGTGYQSVGLVLEAGDRSFLSTQTLPGTFAVFSADDN